MKYELLYRSKRLTRYGRLYVMIVLISSALSFVIQIIDDYENSNRDKEFNATQKKIIEYENYIISPIVPMEFSIVHKFQLSKRIPYLVYNDLGEIEIDTAKSLIIGNKSDSILRIKNPSSIYNQFCSFQKYHINANISHLGFDAKQVEKAILPKIIFLKLSHETNNITSDSVKHYKSQNTNTLELYLSNSHCLISNRLFYNLKDSLFTRVSNIKVVEIGENYGNFLGIEQLSSQVICILNTSYLINPSEMSITFENVESGKDERVEFNIVKRSIVPMMNIKTGSKLKNDYNMLKDPKNMFFDTSNFDNFNHPVFWW